MKKNINGLILGYGAVLVFPPMLIGSVFELWGNIAAYVAMFVIAMLYLLLFFKILKKNKK